MLYLACNILYWHCNIIISPKLVFWIFNCKSIFGIIWSEKVKAICFLENRHAHAHAHTHSPYTQYLEDIEDIDSCSKISFLKLQTYIRFWSQFQSKRMNSLLFPEASTQGCDSKDREEDFEANIKMNNCIKCFILLKSKINGIVG